MSDQTIDDNTIHHQEEDVFKFATNIKNKEDQNDSKRYKPIIRSTPNIGTLRTLSEISIDSDYYNMSPGERGTAIIFNHCTFDYGMHKRSGTMKDCDDLEAVLKSLKFNVRVCHDLKYEEIYKILIEVAKADHSNSDCLLIAVLSHGESGKVFARDLDYPVSDLWNHFSGDRCTTLAGKPKIFFIQACRGEEVDAGVEVSSPVQHDGTYNSIIYKIPTKADFLVMYSTFDGYYAWRHPVNGSWFIQSLCAELKEHAKNKDLQTILTFVNRRVATKYQSNVSYNPRMHAKKQIGTIVSTLTRLIHFGLLEE